MGFLISTFKRRRPTEEVELGSATETTAKPYVDASRAPAQPKDEPASLPPFYDSDVAQCPVKDRAAYFEALILARRSPGAPHVPSQPSPRVIKSMATDGQHTGGIAPQNEGGTQKQPFSTPPSDIDHLLLALKTAEKERSAALAELHHKCLEVENLRSVMRELAESRAAACAARADLAERCCDLHRDVVRACRVLNVTSVASRESKEAAMLAKVEAANAMKEAMEAKAEAKSAATAEKRAAKENAKLRGRLHWLERLGVLGAPGMTGESTCRRQFCENRIMETY